MLSARRAAAGSCWPRLHPALALRLRPSSRALTDPPRGRTHTPAPEPPTTPAPVPWREHLWTLPNALTLSRLVVTPVVGYAVLHERPGLAVGLLAYAAATDLLDGYLARRLNRRSVVGSVLDPMADKALITVLTLSLAAQGSLPVWLAAVIVGRDATLAVWALWYRFVSLPPPCTLARYADLRLPSAEVRPTAISKANTALQLLLVGATAAAPLLPPPAYALLAAALPAAHYLVATTTVASGVSYLFSTDAVRILPRPRPGP